MADRDQLEIISPAGEVSFHELDHDDGVANIGSNPSNDIVLTGPGIADFHFLLDHRQRPYQVALLSDTGRASVGGVPLAVGEYREVHPWDSIELDGYTVILMEGAPSPSVAPVPIPVGAAAPPPAPPPETAQPADSVSRAGAGYACG